MSIILRQVHYFGILALFSCIFLPVTALSNSFSAKIQDSKGKPVEDAVVALLPESPEIFSKNHEEKTAIMDQVDKQFTPHVLAVRAGTTVSFPNSDNIRHHVYSFSEVKIFEHKLYSKDEKKTVLFDKPGIVVLGCNIHDSMVGYIYVADTPFFSVSDARGNTAINMLPRGDYKLHIWHPRQKAKSSLPFGKITISDAPFKTTLVLKIKSKKKRERVNWY